MTDTIIHPDASISGFTCLVNMAAHYGTQGTIKGFKTLAGGLNPTPDLFSVIQLAKQFDMDVVPMEGGFDDLKACDFPLLALLHGEEARFVVVLGVDATTVPVLDPVRGREDILHQDFQKVWENGEGIGEVMAVSPGEKFEDLARRLKDGSSLIYRTRWQLGLFPPWPRKLAYLFAMLAVPLLALYFSPEGGFNQLIGLGLSMAVLASLWSTLFAGGCPSCHGAAKFAGGLPLGPIGVLSYAVTLLLWALANPWANAAIWFAAGAHLGLVITLVRVRLVCPACLVTAGGAWLAGAALAQNGDLSTGQMLIFLAAALLVFPALRLARYHLRLSHFRGAFTLADTVWAETTVPKGKVRVVVYKRKGCAHCLIYEAAIRPALEQEFGDMLMIEERETRGQAIDVPMMILQGENQVLMLNLVGEDGHINARQAILKAGGISEMDVPHVSVVLPPVWSPGN